MLYLHKEPVLHPTALLVRSVPAKRLKRVRIAWFILGTFFGWAAAFYAFTLLHGNREYSKRPVDPPAYAQSEPAKISTATPTAASLPAAPVPALSASTLSSPASPATQATVPAAPPVPSQAHTAPLPVNINIPVHRGDTLMSVLIHKGIEYSEANTIIKSMRKLYNPKSLNVGQSLQLHMAKNSIDGSKPSLTGLSIAVSPLKTIALERAAAGNSFTTKEIKAPVTRGVERAGGTIHSSLYQTAVDSGIPPQMIEEIIQALSYDVDFQRDIQEGDKLDVVYERMHTDKNITAGYGNVLYASLTLSGEQLTIYRYAQADGFSGFYNGKGESVKKALLRTPINGARITSGFGMRMHPLLGYSRMHKGIDFGAPTGTPIYAAGDGVIDIAGRKAGYGNYVRIRHNNSYETAYAHASRIAHGIHNGAHVRQGQVIAYVGSTGQSTGPHLHYEILIGGRQVNPSGVKFRTGQTLQGHDLVQFKHQVQQVGSVLATTPLKTQVAELR